MGGCSGEKNGRVWVITVEFLQGGGKEIEKKRGSG